MIWTWQKVNREWYKYLFRSVHLHYTQLVSSFIVHTIDEFFHAPTSWKCTRPWTHTLGHVGVVCAAHSIIKVHCVPSGRVQCVNNEPSHALRGPMICTMSIFYTPLACAYQHQLNYCVSQSLSSIRIAFMIQISFYVCIKVTKNCLRIIGWEISNGVGDQT